MGEQKSSFIISNTGAGEQGFPNTEPRIRQTLPDAEKNVSFLLAAWLLEEEREEGTVSSKWQIASSPGEELLREAEKGQKCFARRSCVRKEILGIETLVFLSGLQKSSLLKF